MDIVKVMNLNKSYGDFKAVNGVSFQLTNNKHIYY